MKNTDIMEQIKTIIQKVAKVNTSIVIHKKVLSGVRTVCFEAVDFASIDFSYQCLCKEQLALNKFAYVDAANGSLLIRKRL